jgi:hypothetical protein
MTRPGLNGEIEKICHSTSKAISSNQLFDLENVMTRRFYVLLLTGVCAGVFIFLAGFPIATLHAKNTDQATLVVVVNGLGEMVKRSDAPVRIYAHAEAADGTAGGAQLVATTTIGKAVDVPAGTYRVELEVLGGVVTRPEVLTKAGRKSTVIINEVAGLEVDVLDKDGNDLGIGVEVYDGVSKEKLGATLSGEVLLAYPGVVDIKVSTPPQAQWWRQVELRGGGVQHLQIRERVQGQLVVHPLINGRDVSAKTGVIIYFPGTQKEAARSEPGEQHRFLLDSGPYDIFVANQTGQGQPFVMDRAEVKGEEVVEKDVALDKQGEQGGQEASAAELKLPQKL